eukprot:8182368-Alexandrium_andersonii.AAC.1
MVMEMLVMMATTVIMVLTGLCSWRPLSRGTLLGSCIGTLAAAAAAAFCARPSNTEHVRTIRTSRA